MRTRSLREEASARTPIRGPSRRSPLEPAPKPSKREGSSSGHDPGVRGARPRGVVAPLEEVCFQPEAGSAICVQSLDDSLNSAIRTTYRISLRSSSLLMPRYPSTRVMYFGYVGRALQTNSEALGGRAGVPRRNARRGAAEAGCESGPPQRRISPTPRETRSQKREWYARCG